MKTNKKVVLNKNVGGIFFSYNSIKIIPNKGAGGIFFVDEKSFEHFRVFSWTIRESSDNKAGFAFRPLRNKILPAKSPLLNNQEV